MARRPVVERFFAWINRKRRLVEDFEATIESVEAFQYAASSVVMPRCLACPCSHFGNTAESDVCTTANSGPGATSASNSAGTSASCRTTITGYP